MADTSIGRIKPQKMAFCERTIPLKTIERAYHYFSEPGDIPPLTYAGLEEFLHSNSIESGNLLLHISDFTPIAFITVVKKSNEIKIQFYVREEGINRSLYNLVIEYPDVNRESYEEDFFAKPSYVTVVYGIVHGLDRFGKRWIL